MRPSGPPSRPRSVRSSGPRRSARSPRRRRPRGSRGSPGSKRRSGARADPAVPPVSAVVRGGRGTVTPRRGHVADCRGPDDRADRREVEALTAASVAALTVWMSMVEKEIQRGAEIAGSALRSPAGGRGSGAGAGKVPPTRFSTPRKKKPWPPLEIGILALLEAKPGKGPGSARAPEERARAGGRRAGRHRHLVRVQGQRRDLRHLRHVRLRGLADRAHQRRDPQGADSVGGELLAKEPDIQTIDIVAVK